MTAAALFNAPVAQWIEQRSSSAPCAGSSPAGGASFNAASNECSSEPGRCLVSSEAPGCRGDAYTMGNSREMTTRQAPKANAGRWSAWLHPTLRPAASRAFRCRSLPLAAAFFFATPVDQVTDIPRPYAHMQADELADEITVCRVNAADESAGRAMFNAVRDVMTK